MVTELLGLDVERAEAARENGDGDLPPRELVPYLDDLHRLNAWFGGYRLSLRAIGRLMARRPSDERIVVLDVGGSRGELAMRLVRDCRRRRRPVRVIVVDRDRASLEMGRGTAASWPEIVWVRADAATLPMREGAVDVAVMSLTLHHLEPPLAAAALAGMRRAARLGVVVNDLLRTRLGLLLVWLATRLFARHPFARHDGPLSVRRAYSARELRGLAGRAGLDSFAIRSYPVLARLVMVAR